MAKIDLNEEIIKKHPSLTCMFCGNVLKATTNFYPSFSRNTITRTDDKGTTRLPICKDCAQQFYNYLCKVYKKPEQALFQFCAALDVYYSEELYQKVKDGDFDKTISNYFGVLQNDATCSGKTFAETILGDKVFTEQPKEQPEEETLNEEDDRNRSEILSLYHYDPFAKESVAEKKKLYRDLVTMIDPAMADDLVRQRAALEIVRSFARIDTWTETINELSKDPQSMMRHSKEIKALTEAKNKETDMITKFCKDHGFAERYATAKSRGAGTLSATIRDMEEFNFDDGKVNLYDIKTSATMQQAADISTSAIMKQLNLSEADYIDMLKQQRERMVMLEQELNRSNETLRMVYKQITKQDLLKELAYQLKQKGLNNSEVAKAIKREIRYNDEEVKQDCVNNSTEVKND